jgi:RNA polymerase sigma factor (sigma-70 family)
MEKTLVDLKQATDEELMLAYQNGQLEAFDSLFYRHRGRVYGYLIKKLGKEHQADEVLQATFMKLHQARHQYEVTLPFGPWLFTICRNTLTDFFRSEQRINQNEELNAEAVAEAPAEALSQSHWVPPMESLSIEHRQAIELRYLQELSFEEISKKMKITPSNARQIVSRAMRKLKKLIQKTEGEQ